MGDSIGVRLPVREIYLSLTNHPCQLSLAIPSWVGATPYLPLLPVADALRLGGKADMVLFAGDTV